MDTGRYGTRGVVALLPFLVKGALSLSVLRAMRTRGLDITLAHQWAAAPGYTTDPASDFAADDRLLDLSLKGGGGDLEALDAVIEARDVGLVLQIGAPGAYAMLPYLKERHPGLQIVDTLYNEVGHTVDHFLYENCLDAVIVESWHMSRFVERRSAKAGPRIAVVESGIDLEHYTPRSSGPARDDLVLGYIGRMSPEKNPLGFVKLAEQLAPDHPGVSFVLFGEGGMTDEVKARIAASGLDDRIRFEGYFDDVRDGLASIDALVVPSLVDGRPNIIMEANAFGRPVLATAVGGIPELIDNGRNGHLISLGDIDGVGSILRDWTTDRAGFAALAASSRDTALARFDRRRMLDAYEATFRSFLGSEPAPIPPAREYASAEPCLNIT